MKQRQASVVLKMFEVKEQCLYPCNHVLSMYIIYLFPLSYLVGNGQVTAPKHSLAQTVGGPS